MLTCGAATKQAEPPSVPPCGQPATFAVLVYVTQPYTPPDVDRTQMVLALCPHHANHAAIDWA